MEIGSLKKLSGAKQASKYKFFTQLLFSFKIEYRINVSVWLKGMGNI